MDILKVPGKVRMKRIFFLPGNFCMEILKVSGIVRLQRTLFSRHFLWKKCLGKCGSEEHFFARHFFIKILKVLGKVRSGCNEIKLVVFDLVRTV